MSRLQHIPDRPDEPDFLGLTEERALRLANERGLVLRLIPEEGEVVMDLAIIGGRVTAELEGGVIVYAQRY